LLVDGQYWESFRQSRTLLESLAASGRANAEGVPGTPAGEFHRFRRCLIDAAQAPLAGFGTALALTHAGPSTRHFNMARQEMHWHSGNRRMCAADAEQKSPSPFAATPVVNHSPGRIFMR
jgi:hypothetical protein